MANLVVSFKKELVFSDSFLIQKKIPAMKSCYNWKRKATLLKFYSGIWVFVNLLYIFRRHILKNTPGGLLLKSVPSQVFTVVLATASDFFFHNQKQSSKGVLRNFAKFTGKHLYKSLFFNKVAGLSPPALLKKTLVQVFFLKIFAKCQRKHLRPSFFNKVADLTQQLYF